jgi:exopolyphosphatase / guanosine-5'-triphosphate,3'-diphosphate pyrophosphatase
MRVATIDIGTNTVLLLVADRKADGALVALAERATITRLGAGVDRNRSLDPEAVERTCDCLRRYAEVVAELAAERIAVVGTSAMRDARGGEAVIACVQQTLGVEARVLSGPEEARLTFSGATSGLNLGELQQLAVFDIGGGSTEIALGRHEKDGPALSYLQSFDLGSVRLTERHVANDPLTAEEREILASAARQSFAEVPPLGKGAIAVGVAGTMTTLAAVALGMTSYDGARLHGHRVSRREMRRVVEQLAFLSLKDRRNVPGIHPMRADVIVAGGFIALALLDHWEAESVVVSDRGVRWGLAEELAQS